MINGHVFLTDAGMDLTRVEKSKRNVVVQNFCDMREKRCASWKDFFYVDPDFYTNKCFLYKSPSESCWEGVSKKTIEKLQHNFNNSPKIIKYAEFCEKTEPRTQGGFEYNNHPITDYVYNCCTLDEWHNENIRNYTDCVEWESEIFPFKSRNIEILKGELAKITENSANYDSNEKKDLFRVQNNRLKDDDDVVNCFHCLVVKHKSTEERIAYVKNIVKEICEANGYRRELELEKLEHEHGNRHAETIYCIKNRNGEYIFLCIDKRHGMIEWCDDNGSHKGERRFDGSKNSDADPEDHSLKCVAEWKSLKK